MATANGPMMLDDDGGRTAIPQDIQAKDADGVPYCVKHHVRMALASGAQRSKGKDYYKCPVEGCGETGIKIRKIPERMIPTQPQLCARCKPAVVCEKDTKRSTSQFVVLTCPKCGWHLPPMVLPQVAAVMNGQQSRKTPDIGDR